LTQQVPFEMVDAVLAATCRTQRRVRDLPSRVVVYLLLAAGLFAELGYRQVWARLTAGLEAVPTAFPTSSALAQARTRIGPAPLKALFDLIKGPGAGAARWHGLLVVAMDGTTLSVPDAPANLATFGRQAGSHGGSGYPLLRLVAVVACGTRTVLDAVFAPIRVGETTLAPALAGCLRPGMLLLADRNFAVCDLVAKITATGAGVLVRCKDGRVLPCVRRLPDGSWLSLLGSTGVRVVDAQITVTGPDGRRRVGRYRLVTTLTDHARFPALDLVRLYHQRWEIETVFLEFKATTLGGRVLRARTPAGIEQEVWALLAGYQALRLAMADAVSGRNAPAPDRASFTVALAAARDQVVKAAGVIAGTALDLVGAIGRAVLADPLPARRTRVSPRVVKRAISKHRAKGPLDRANYQAAISTEIITATT
jgi:Insertion element 4 transposase N-terminal/Transposase DDE domain